MAEKILITLLTVVITALVSYFFASITSKKSAERLTTELKEDILKRITETMSHHNEVNHKVDTYTIVKEKLNEHVETCGGSVRLQKIERALVFLVTKAGGSLKDLELE